MPAETHLIEGRWIPGTGAAMVSLDPAHGTPAWEGRAATAAEVNLAFVSARRAFNAAIEFTPTKRIALVEAVAEQYRTRKVDLISALCQETGKPRWESAAEVDLMIGKIAISIEAFAKRCAEEIREDAPGTSGATAATRYRPHGVVAVLGPFNMPGHLPNGHLIPAVLAGNAVIFKPSEQAPSVGAVMASAWQAAITAAAFPPGLFQLLQGDATTGKAIASHPQLDGLFFTGSAAGGKALNMALADRPQIILALEMGGNNPLVIDDPADLEAAAYLTIQSAFVSAGQRCTCARRLIVPEGENGDEFIGLLVKSMRKIRVGFPEDEPEPFYGTVISEKSADHLLEAQGQLLDQGATVLLPMRLQARSAALLSPGLIDVTAIPERADIEHFGPLLQLIRVANFEAAIAEANATRYGLAAGLVGQNRQRYQTFYRRVRAGIINWNRPLTGASSRSPFGGVGISGNHRPSAYFAADYCSFAVASLEAAQPNPKPTTIPGLG